MSNSKLKTRIKNFVKNNLSEFGFVLIEPRLIERKCDGLIQGIEFQPGTGHLSGKYTLNIYWRFNYIPKDYISFDSNRRIGYLIDTKDIWFSREGEQLEIDFEKIKTICIKTIIPFFEKYSSLEKLVDNYLHGNISKQEAFGISLGWQCFNAGFSFAILNEKEKAIQELKQLISEYSNDDIKWIQERKDYALQKLNELEKS